MNTNRFLQTAILLLAPTIGFCDEKPDTSLTGLEETAAAFITAFNKKDATTVAGLFSEDGELCGRDGEDLTSGRDDIKAHFEEIFAEDDAPSIALEVKSVRLIGESLAVEDGVAHYTAPGENVPPRSFSYASVLQKDGDGKWKIASSRLLDDVTSPAGRLSDLEADLKGDWSAMKDGVRLDLAFGWDPDGTSLHGELLTTSSDGDAQSGSIRIAWDGSKKSIVSWLFDGKGGFSQGTWTPDEDGWLIRTEGTTADGETMSANQQVTIEGPNALVWNITNKVVAGEKQPDIALRLVRRAPEPTDKP